MAVYDLLKQFHQDMIAWRHDIHAHPETAFEEFRTSDIVAEKLTEHDRPTPALGAVVEVGLVAELERDHGLVGRELIADGCRGREVVVDQRRAVRCALLQLRADGFDAIDEWFV